MQPKEIEKELDEVRELLDKQSVGVFEPTN
jgi:hypothetical protein